MSQRPVDNLAEAAARKRSLGASIILPALLLLGATIMGADITAIALSPLKALGISYPGWMDYSHLLIAGGCAMAWLIFRGRRPNSAAIVAVLLCYLLISLVPLYAGSRVARMPVVRWLDSDELKSIEDALGIPVFETGSSDGNFVIVAPMNKQRTRAELKQRGLLRIGSK